MALIKIPNELLDKDISVPDLTIKGKVIKEALERTLGYLKESKQIKKMSNKKLLKEAITPEQKQELMIHSVSVAESILKLYKYVTSEVQSPGITSIVSKLKSHSDDFLSTIEGEEGSLDDRDTELEPLERTVRGKDMIESANKNSKSKNVRKKLVENKGWKLKLNLAKEYEELQNQADEDFVEIQGNPIITKIVEKLSSYEEQIQKLFGDDARLKFEDIVNELKHASDEDDFNYAMSDLYDFCDEYRIWLSTDEL